MVFWAKDTDRRGEIEMKRLGKTVLTMTLTTVLMIVYCTLSLSSVSVFLYFNF